MPNRVVSRVAKKLSAYYYNYGKTVASRTCILLLFSLSFISYFSLPYLNKSRRTGVTPTTLNNIPLSQISTSLDAQCWHASAHVQFNNFTLTRHLPPSHYLITERIRLSHPDRPITFELIQKAKEIYLSIASTIVMDDNQPVSLNSICYQHQGHCLIHAPPFEELNTIADWKETTNLHNQPSLKYETHPYSIYLNTTFDAQDELVKADAVVITFILKQTQNGNTLRIWNSILHQVKLEHHILNVDNFMHDGDISNGGSIWYASANTSSQMLQYKFNLFPFELSYKVQFSIVAYMIAFYLVSVAFGKSNLVKSGYSFGLAAVFLSIACFTTTWGIFIKLGISLNTVPWYLLLISVNVASLENVFLLTNAVLYAGCDMIVIEKVSRGLQSVGVPMTATLVAELIILSLGGYMDNALIKEFCMFTKVALCVDYLLEMTFVIAVLSIDIKRVELADLDDRQMSKRLHELANHESETENQQPDFCPVQDTPNKDDSKSCADCKDFKTHRIFNALMLCFVVLSLALFCSKDTNHHHHQLHKLYQPELNQLSDQFWSTVNPNKDVTWLQIEPPHLLIYSTDPYKVSEHVEQLQQLYLAKYMVIRTKIQHGPSLFRSFIVSSLQNLISFILNINVPMLILCLVMVGIITWMTPKWRDQWLLPLITHTFNQVIYILLDWFPLQRVYLYMRGLPYEGESKEYDADGIQHHGAISVQNIFNQQQYRANVKQVQVRTLKSHHVADIQNLDANAQQSLVSCGQDGRIVLWNADVSKATWVARLDKLSLGRGGVVQAIQNPDFSMKRKSASKQKKKVADTLTKARLPKARCVSVDQGNKWIAGGYEDGVVRIWNVSTGTLVREMEYQPHLPSVVEVQEVIAPKLRNRFNANPSATSITNMKREAVDRILFLQFIGAVAEYCHPLVAEVASRVRSNDEECQNFVITAHKSGVLHEWDIVSGECIQTVKTGHTKDMTQLHVVDSKTTPHRKSGVTWVFTASKDGTVKCWERRLIQAKDEDECSSSHWLLAYTIEQTSPVTSIVTELPVGGMGVLVTGCNDGSVRVWNFETGESICTLSVGKSTTASPATSIVDNLLVGGPIRKFSKFSTLHSELSSSSEEEEGNESDTNSTYSRASTVTSGAADHRGAIYQVVVTRYCEVENGPGLCRGCDTCFGNGFLIASSSMDNKVHAWRLERSDSGHEGSCTLCTKDYHRKQYKHRKSSISEDAGPEAVNKLTPNGRRRRRSSSQQIATSTKKRFISRPVMNASNDSSVLELLDIEQLAGDAHIPLKATFLGKIDQPAGHGVVFCDKILAGVRRRRQHHHQPNNHNQKGGEWETWFASLQYYNPSLSKEEGIVNMMRIPIETFDLDHDDTMPLDSQKEDDITSAQALKGTLLSLFTKASGTTEKKTIDHQLKYKRIHATIDNVSDDESAEDPLEDEDILEASENLPFSAVRHIIPLDGCGLACDFGNFIKLVYLDKPSLTEKAKIKQASDSREGRPPQQLKIVEQAVIEEEEEEVDSGCQCDDDDNGACSPKNKDVDGCCGGANKSKDGKCCGGGAGNVKKQQDEKRRLRSLQKKQQLQQQQQAVVTPNACSGVRSLADCSLRNNCSRASDCVSSSPASYSFSNWL
ncbi:hypothetical protein INT47_002965 [Mucor saturninus]|uniref:Sterol regulatory element-binding protein cleavage-activating protein n=1 Tax=Mucor saturninus TaxID=64648 RepID=A0A8H7QUD1_9FUNG|nr:hypothetical protein INT47_002965 [Mucor saturninus]